VLCTWVTAQLGTIGTPGKNSIKKKGRNNLPCCSREEETDDPLQGFCQCGNTLQLENIYLKN